MIISVSDHGSTAPTDPPGFAATRADVHARRHRPPIPNWVTYAAPFAERTRGYVSGLDATGQAARTYSTVYRMRAVAAASGHRLIDGAQTFRVVGISDIAPGWIQVEIA